MFTPARQFIGIDLWMQVKQVGCKLSPEITTKLSPE